MKNTRIKIKGMDCSSCVINIDGALEEIEGVDKSETNYIRSQTDVIFNPKKVSLHRILATIKQTGYDAEVIS